ncbi:hypothetical protein, partial [Dialister hominis]|uniref:hypothetical protein n=1 Tax=Dialister hominis TaxID=2582419 RepID=UPI00307A71AE
MKIQGIGNRHKTGLSAAYYYHSFKWLTPLSESNTFKPLLKHLITDMLALSKERFHALAIGISMKEHII